MPKALTPNYRRLFSIAILIYIFSTYNIIREQDISEYLDNTTTGELIGRLLMIFIFAYIIERIWNFFSKPRTNTKDKNKPKEKSNFEKLKEKIKKTFVGKFFVKQNKTNPLSLRWLVLITPLALIYIPSSLDSSKPWWGNLISIIFYTIIIAGVTYPFAKWWKNKSSSKE